MLGSDVLRAIPSARRRRISEVIQHNDTGYIVDVGDYKQAADRFN